MEIAYELPERRVAFMWCGVPGGSLLGLREQGSIPMGIRLHVAFAISLDEVLTAPERLARHNVEARSFFGEPAMEPSVIAWMPAAAVLFRDPDDHSLEYLAMPKEQPRDELGVVPWSQWAALHSG